MAETTKFKNDSDRIKLGTEERGLGVKETPQEARKGVRERAREFVGSLRERVFGNNKDSAKETANEASQEIIDDSSELVEATSIDTGELTSRIEDGAETFFDEAQSEVEGVSVDTEGKVLGELVSPEQSQQADTLVLQINSLMDSRNSELFLQEARGAVLPSEQLNQLDQEIGSLRSELSEIGTSEQIADVQESERLGRVKDLWSQYDREVEGRDREEDPVRRKEKEERISKLEGELLTAEIFDARWDNLSEEPLTE